MGPVPTIDVRHADDPRLADYRHLNDADLRRAHDPQRGVCIGEGELVLRVAVDAGAALRSVLVSDKRFPAVADVVDPLAEAGLEVYRAPQAALEAVVGFRLHRGVVAALDRPPARTLSAVAGGATRVLAVEGVNDHENLGSLFRNAAGLGAEGVVLDTTTADPLYRRSIRVSMGQALRLGFHRSGDWLATLDQLRADGFELVAVTPGGGDVAAAGLAEVERVAMVVGAEGPGLTAATLARVDRHVGIAMSAGVDSLNVATAAAIALHSARRR